MLAVSIASMSACDLAQLDIQRCPARLLPGDLVITEIMANPPGPALAGATAPPWAAGEWLELHNASGRSIDLQGVVLTAGEGDERRMHMLHDLVIAPGAYLVAAANGPAAPGAGASAGTMEVHGYGADLGDLPDEGGRLAVRCDVVEVDAVVYAATTPGVALGLSGAEAPAGNDGDDDDEEAAPWCATAAGTPGARNPACPGDSGPGDGPAGCTDGDAVRAPVRPGPGDLVISEVMPNPDAVADGDGEWVELYVAADVDLNGLAVGREPGSPRTVIEDEACLHAAAGTHLVLANNADPAQNGGLPRVDHQASLGLTNSNGTLFVGVGDEVLDQVAWASSRAGTALALDPASLSPEGNDDAAQWCDDAVNAYGDGDLGTPGSANASCSELGPGDPGSDPGNDDTCDDDGTPRPKVGPTLGQVTITEYMPNPDAVSDADGEWLELRVDADVDLNGLELGKTPGDVLVTIAAEACLRVTAGTHVVLAHEADAALNGGLPRVDAVFDFSLVNSSGSVFVGAAGAVLDQVSYSSSSAGVATSRDPDAAGDGSNDGAVWCPSPAEPYGAGDRGSPGAANPACPALSAEPMAASAQ